jgi:hypothetical protein
VVWCIGFQPDFGWLDAPAFNGRGQPGHVRGVTAVPGLYVIGLPWLHTRGSGRFSARRGMRCTWPSRSRRIARNTTRQKRRVSPLS